MPKIDMLPFGTAGVDMRTHPHLLPDKKKLRSAVNLRFEEGVIRTRFGFRYQALTEPGQFQGACLFQPIRGISSGTFSNTAEGVAVVSGGDLWFRCSRIAAGQFCNKGLVHLYQAENYLILQNPSSSTYWWDGVTLSESPGMQDVDFNDPETPWVELSEDAPVGDPNVCEPEGDGEGEGDCITTLSFVIQDAETQEPVLGHLEVRVNAGLFFEGTVGTGGVQTFASNVHHGKANDWIVTAAGYLDKSGSLVPIECQGNVVYVQLEKIAALGCGLAVSNLILEGGEPNEGWFTVTNVGGIAVTLNSLDGDVEVVGTVPELPLEIPVGGSFELYVQCAAALTGTTMTLDTTCEDPVVIEWPDPLDTCQMVVTNTWNNTGIQDGGNPEDPNSYLQQGFLIVQNTGGSPFDVVSIDSDKTIFAPGPAPIALPVTVAPGTTEYIHMLHDSIVEGDIRGSDFTVTFSCGDPFSDTWVLS